MCVLDFEDEKKEKEKKVKRITKKFEKEFSLAEKLLKKKMANLQEKEISFNFEVRIIFDAFDFKELKLIFSDKQIKVLIEDVINFAKALEIKMIVAPRVESDFWLLVKRLVSSMLNVKMSLNDEILLKSRCRSLTMAKVQSLILDYKKQKRI
jgi:vacuolar-type H+-ATPase subunit E/Vma4